MIHQKEFEDIIMEKRELSFEFLGLNLLISRLIETYRINPSAEVMDKCLEELETFILKYNRILKKELAEL